jgi:hypothetical protein
MQVPLIRLGLLPAGSMSPDSPAIITVTFLSFAYDTLSLPVCILAVLHTDHLVKHLKLPEFFKTIR